METKLEKFIQKAKLIHGDYYDYSLVEYINCRGKIKITCPIHGEFNQIANNHLMGSGCNECNNNNKKARLNFENKSNVKHEFKYNYSLVEYINNKSKVKIICPVHGEFEQTPLIHLQGCGCPKCSDNKLNKVEFIIKAKKIHGDKYDYSLSEYIGSKIKLKIICPIHGEFEQIPNHHLSGAGCPICNESRGEREIRKFLDNNNIVFIKQKIFNECRDKKPLAFDFYLPNHNMCIEFNGRQHYEVVRYWGGELGFEKQKKRDMIKKDYCEKNGLKLIIINNLKNIKLLNING